MKKLLFFVFVALTFSVQGFQEKVNLSAFYNDLLKAKPDEALNYEGVQFVDDITPEIEGDIIDFESFYSALSLVLDIEDDLAPKLDEKEFASIEFFNVSGDLTLRGLRIGDLVIESSSFNQLYLEDSFIAKVYMAETNSEDFALYNSEVEAYEDWGSSYGYAEISRNEFFGLIDVYQASVNESLSVNDNVFHDGFC